MGDAERLGNVMLRITIQNGADELQLKVEGKLGGPWVAELEDCWRASVAKMDAHRISVDLTSVTCVDAAGKYLLALMCKSGARFVTAGPMLPQLVEEIGHNWPAEERKGDRS